MNLADALQRIRKARTSLVLNSPFFASLTMNMSMEVVDCIPGMPPELSTAVTDSKNITWTEAFVDKLSRDEIIGVMKHEVMHAALGHCYQWRMGGREINKWRAACDYVVNALLKADGVKLPEPHLYEPRYAGMSTEQVYNELKHDEVPGSDQPDMCGGIIAATNDDGSKMSEAEAQQNADEWTRRMAQAAQAERMCGKGSSAMDRFVNDLLYPKADWKQILRDLVEHVARNDYTMFPPSRRWVHRNLCLPTLRSDELGRIAIAIDTSGSIDEDALNQFGSEISTILSQYHCEDISVMYCDSRIRNRQSLSSNDLPITFEPKGGGGTSFHPVFEELEENQPAALIYFTDLCVYDYPAEPDYPVIWANTYKGADEPPFGQVVNIW